MMTKTTTILLRTCGDCRAAPGELHEPGCDVERCPRCGGQMICCGCVYEVNWIDRDSMEEVHPDIYYNGPTEAMYAKWDAEWGSIRLPWTGEWPGTAECKEHGFWCYWRDGYGWTTCEADHPGATPDFNRLAATTNWNPVIKKYVRV